MKEASTVPWWKKEDPRFITRVTELISGWCLHNIVKDALVDGKVIERFSAEGEFEGDVEQIAALVQASGGRVVSNKTTHSLDLPDKRMHGRFADRNIKGGFIAVWPDGYVNVSIKSDDWSEFELYTTDAELGRGLIAQVSPLLKKRGTKRDVYVLVKTDDGYDMSSLGAHGMELERGNYDADTLDAYDHVLGDFREASPCGRIVVIEGPPGTGKTHLIRGMIQECEDTTFVLLPPTMIEGISGPNVIQALVGWHRSSSGPIVFVMEDADAVLAARKFDNINAVNEILNLGDGILGAALDIRIVATTNTGRAELDAAITRDGRLCRHMEVNKLDVATAQAVADRIGAGVAVLEPTTLASIYGLLKGKRSRKPTTKAKAGF